MGSLGRPDGADIAWDERGESGPLVILTSYWSGHPAVYDDLLSDLAGDHRVVTHDARGTGRSTRAGPYDFATDCADLAALIDAAGGPAVILSVADGTNRAVRVAAERPDLVAAVVGIGTPPMFRKSFSDSEAMVGSESVVEAFLGMLERDYRGALRTLLAATNPQMDEAELAERVRFQADYAPAEAVVPRVREWAEDDPTEDARAVGERLWVLYSRDVAGPWLPPAGKFRRRISQLLPEARLVEVEDGAVSRPELTAAVVREITAPARAGAGALAGRE